MSARARATLVGLIIAVLWGGALGYAHLSRGIPVIERIEATLTDLRVLFRGARPAPDSVLVIAIDDAAAGAVGSYPLPRAVLARLVETIAAARASVLAIDILLVDAGPADGDAALAKALALVPTVLASAATFPPGGSAAAAKSGPLADVPTASTMLLPQARLLAAASAGIVNVHTDGTGTPRAVPLILAYGGGVEAAMPLRAVALALAADVSLDTDAVLLGALSIPTDRGYALPLSFYGPAGTVRTLSAAALMDGSADPAQIAGRAVVLGSTVTGGGDIFSTPFDPVLPGVEVQATAIANMLSGDVLVRDGRVRTADAATAVLLPMVLVGFLGSRRTAMGMAAASAALLLWLVLNCVAFTQGYWLSAALPLAAGLPPALLFGAWLISHGRRAAQHYRLQSETLQRIQAPGLTQFLARNPDFLAKPVEQDAAIVFVDLSGFTGLSERLGAAATREILDSFYHMVDETVAGCGGIITSFMGDGVMILFGLPRPEPADAERAARCCVALSKAADAWLAGLTNAAERPDGYKIGAHFGPVVASRLGRGAHRQIAATGDTVNVASRLMATAAARAVPAAASDSLVRAAGAKAFEPGRLEGPFDIEIRGRAGTVSAWTWMPPGKP